MELVHQPVSQCGRPRVSMTLPEIKAFVGKRVVIEYLDRLGHKCVAEGSLWEVEFVPMYGCNLIGDFGEIQLDKVVSLVEFGKQAA